MISVHILCIRVIKHAQDTLFDLIVIDDIISQYFFVIKKGNNVE